MPRCCLKNATHLTPKPNPVCTSGIKAASNAPTARGHTALLVNVGIDGAAESSAELYHVDSSSKATLIDRAGRFKCGDSVQCGVATVTGVAAAEAHTVVLMVRKGMFEVYIDELLVQSFVCACHSSLSLRLCAQAHCCTLMPLNPDTRTLRVARRRRHLPAACNGARRPLWARVQRHSCCQGDGEQGVENGPARLERHINGGRREKD